MISQFDEEILFSRRTFSFNCYRVATSPTTESLNEKSVQWQRKLTIFPRKKNSSLSRKIHRKLSERISSMPRAFLVLRGNYFFSTKMREREKKKEKRQIIERILFVACFRYLTLHNRQSTDTHISWLTEKGSSISVWWSFRNEFI